MKNSFGWILSKFTNKSEIYGKKIENFPLPELLDRDIFVKYWIQGKDKNKLTDYDIDQILKDGKIHRYIGKIMKDRESLYNQESIIATLQYLYKENPYGSASLQLCPALSEIMNGLEDVQGAMTFQEQKEYILYLNKKYFWTRKDNLYISNMEERNIDLFNALRKGEHEDGDPLRALDFDSKPKLDNKNFTSLDIAKYLYWMTKSNSKFDHQIKSLKAANVSNENHEGPYYYGLVEVACRLTDHLKGINIQGGLGVQGKYDKIIKQIITGSPEWNGMEEINKFCNNILGETVSYKPYITIHLLDKKYQKLIDREIITNLKSNNIKKIVSTVSFTLLFTLGYIIYSSHHKNKRDFEQKEKTKTGMIRSYVSASDKTLYDNFDQFRQYYKGGEDVDQMIKLIQRELEIVAKRIKYRYDVHNSMSLEDREDFMIDDFLDQKVINNITYENIQEEKESAREEFIEKFIEDNKFRLKTNGVLDIDQNIEELKPYRHLKRYENNFVETLNCPIEKMIRKEDLIHASINSLSAFESDDIRFGICLDNITYTPSFSYNNTTKKIGILGENIKSEYNGLILATENNKEIPPTYRLSSAKSYIIDYFIITQPIHQLTKLFMKEKYMVMSRYRYNDFYKLLVLDYVNNGMIDELDNQTIDEKNTQAIGYLNNFFQRNREEIKKFSL